MEITQEEKETIEKAVSIANRKFADKVGSKSKSVMTLESPGGFILSATPNESYGYMYIKMVWKKDVA